MSTLKKAISIENSQLEKCFKWNETTLPKTFKFISVGMITASQVSIFTSLSFMIAFFYFQNSKIENYSIIENFSLNILIFISIIIFFYSSFLYISFIAT